MAFVKGKSGNPGGRPKDKLWREALNIVVKEKDESDGTKTKLRAIAEVCVNAAMTGDMQAIKEIGDRLDGKPVQALANDDDNPLIPAGMSEKQVDERFLELLRKAGAAEIIGNEESSQLSEIRTGQAEDKDQERVH